METTRPRTPLRTLLAVLATALAVTLGTVLVPASQAQAAPGADRSSSQCQSGQVCFWTQTAFTGAFYSASLLSQPVARSYWNRSAKAVRVYASASGTGSSTCIAAGAAATAVTVATGKVVTLSGTTC